MELIDKAAIVAEIERRIDDHKDEYKRNGDIYASVLIEEEEDILSFLDTLEVKEVDEKSTRHFPHWKPTQEQMSDLYHAATMNSISCPSLESLYNDLKVIAQKEEISECFNKDDFIRKVYEWLKGYAFTDDENKVHLPTLLHDFLKDSRTILKGE